MEKYLNVAAENFKKFRNDAGISQEELAEKLNCSREYINRIENKKDNISMKMLLTAACLFKVAPGDFFIRKTH